ncbi:STAS domain-containing protein [Paractinoplanes atraurantiacus]|uniref:Anti-sigma factor antagonist n=1 Tax=Paractinoplanes atraurantiacus TaxID=1036182 RepID=A0A285GPX1_9ACTN|nr:STAS domain-containing protein [Actinoplanes atraurantiacus]SNY25587.1 anti-anti-sigma factor [Actinoplanes atraurantiacus]
MDFTGSADHHNQPSLEGRIERHKDFTLVAIRGEIDRDTAGYLDALLGDAEADATAAVVVDLEHVGFLGAAGVRVLATRHDELSRHGQALNLVNYQPHVEAVLRICGLRSPAV